MWTPNVTSSLKNSFVHVSAKSLRRKNQNVSFKHWGVSVQEAITAKVVAILLSSLQNKLSTPHPHIYHS